MATRSVLFFCSQPLAARPVSQRIAAFGAYLAEHGWNVHLTDVSSTYDGSPKVTVDPLTGLEVESIGPTHFRVASDGTRSVTSPIAHLRECHDIARRIRQRADSVAADLLVISTANPAGLYSVGALCRSKRPLWLDVDDWSAAHFVGGGGSPLVGAAYGLIERTIPRFANHVTVCSNELARLIPRATVVPNFIRLREVPERPRPPGERQGAERVRVAFPSTITTYYGHRPLIEALARRRRECDGIELRIIGDGDDYGACRDITRRAGLGELVHFTGRLDRAAMLDDLVRCDVAVLPLRDERLDRARFPLKMLDALASGCALAASDVGMERDTLVDRETALLSPPGDVDALLDHVLELASSPELRMRLAKAGSELVRDYDEPVVCERWAGLISSSQLG